MLISCIAYVGAATQHACTFSTCQVEALLAGPTALKLFLRGESADIAVITCAPFFALVTGVVSSPVWAWQSAT